MKTTTTIQVAKKPVPVTFDTDTIWQDFIDAGFSESMLYARLIQKLSYDVKSALVDLDPDSLTLSEMLDLKGSTGRTVAASDVRDALGFLNRLGIAVKAPAKGLAKASASITFPESVAEKLGKGMAAKCDDDNDEPLATLEAFTVRYVNWQNKLKREQASDFAL